ncbi:hypothetical protein [Kitasatospora sp. NPDC004531]
MTLSVAALRERLAASEGGEFRLGAGELGVPAVEQLFTDHLGGGTLTVTGCEALPEQLTVAGSVRLRYLDAPVTVLVSFLAEEGASEVAGVRLDAELPGWEVPAGHLVVQPGILRTFGFDMLYLVLDATPGPDGRTVASVGLGASRPFPGGKDGELAYVSGLKPRFAESAWCLAGDFPPVLLRGPGDLAGLVPGLDEGKFALPTEFNVGPFTVDALSVVFAPGTTKDSGRLLSVWASVELNATWEVFPRYFEVTGMAAEFAVTAAPRGFAVNTLLTGYFRLVKQVEVFAEVVLPGRTVIAQLEEPVALAPLLADWFPGAGLPKELTVQYLRFETVADRGKPTFGLDLDLSGVWKPVDKVSLDELTLSLFVVDRKVEAGLEAVWAIGGGRMLIRAGYANGVWSFGGLGSQLRARDLFGVFGAQPPTPLDGVELRELTVAFDSTGKRIQLGGSVAFPFGAADARLTLDTVLTRKTSGSGYDTQVDGTLTVVLPGPPGGSVQHDTLTGVQSAGPDVLTFKVDYRQADTGWTISGSWESAKGVALTALVAALGVEAGDLPELLTPVLKKLSVRYDSASGDLLLTAETERVGWVFYQVSKGGWRVEPTGG